MVTSIVEGPNCFGQGRNGVEIWLRMNRKQKNDELLMADKFFKTSRQIKKKKKKDKAER